MLKMSSTLINLRVCGIHVQCINIFVKLSKKSGSKQILSETNTEAIHILILNLQIRIIKHEFLEVVTAGV